MELLDIQYGGICTCTCPILPNVQCLYWTRPLGIDFCNAMELGRNRGADITDGCRTEFCSELIAMGT